MTRAAKLFLIIFIDGAMMYWACRAGLTQPRALENVWYVIYFIAGGLFIIWPRKKEKE